MIPKREIRVLKATDRAGTFVIRPEHKGIKRVALGVIGKGWLVRVAPNTYALSEAGRVVLAAREATDG